MSSLSVIRYPLTSARLSGGFAGSCGSIQVNSDGVLSAKCKDGRGGNVATSISIGKFSCLDKMVQEFGLTV